MNRSFENSVKILVGKPEGKMPLGRPRFAWGKILAWTSKISHKYLFLRLSV
jgi:hypothetical protein